MSNAAAAIAKATGLASQDDFKPGEMAAMINQVDLMKPGALLKFKKWKFEDGSKRGLQELLRTPEGSR